MQNTKTVSIEKLSDSSLENISGGLEGFLKGAVVYAGTVGTLILLGTAETIVCLIASVNQFSRGNILAGSGLAAGAVASAGAVAATAVRLKQDM